MADITEHSLHCACVPPSEVHTEVQAEADAVAEVASANVEIAKIESDTAIKLAQIDARQADPGRDAEIAALRDEVRLLKEMAAPPMVPVPDPAPAPAPALVTVVNDAPVEDSLPRPEAEYREPDDKPKKSSGGGLGFW
jgi:hypothetical protein